MTLGLFDAIFGRKGKVVDSGYYKTLTAYQPTFTSFGGSIYEDALVRTAINTIATHISKMNVTMDGSSPLRKQLEKAPNAWQTWSQMLARLATILYINNTAFIVPVFNQYGEVTGIYPVLPSQCKIKDINGQPWLEYTFRTGDKAMLELSECGVMTRFQYNDDFIGESNAALMPTMNLIGISNQGIKEATVSSASYRFMARVNNFIKPEDLKKEKERFNANNLSGEGGLLLFPNNYGDIKQIDSKPFVVPKEQQELIQKNVFNYFNVNEDVIQSKAYGDAWSAFYESVIEPFAVQFSDVVTKMLYTPKEIAFGNKVSLNANRLVYMDTAAKLNMSAQMVDRGIFSRNEVRSMWNLPPIDGGDEYIMRGEYKTDEEKDNGEE